MRVRFLSLIFLFVLLLNQITAQNFPPSLCGRWTFDNPSDLLQATVGNPLLLNGTHQPVPGPSAGDGAIAIDTGSYYTCVHMIPANGGGSLVNEYSLMFDIMIDNPTVYHCFYQTNQNNSNDGEVFINPYSQIGISGTGYTGFSIKPLEWYRVVITADLGSSFRYYVDGKLVLDGVSQSIDGRYSLDPTVLFFADDNKEDNLIYVAQIAIFNTALSETEVYNLGGFHSSIISPYLQSPTSGSMVISWNSYYDNSTLVEYGTTQALGTLTNGTHQDIGIFPNINRWHSVKLTGLQPDTRYYYRCISGSDTSEIFHFRTPPLSGTAGRHIRFLKTGDSQNEVLRIKSIADTMVYALKQLYGNEWADSVTFVMHTGDIQNDGSVLGRYMNEYFNPFSCLSPYLPFMVSIGNHESESPYYYQFMKYEDYTGFNEKYYTFNLGNCQFIALNTNGLYNNFIQTNWLQSQLTLSDNDPGIDFVFTFNHQPGHSEIWPDGNTAYVLNDLYPVQAAFPKMVMTAHGHSHNYERGTITGTHGGNWDFREILCGGAGGALDRWGMYSNQTNYPEIQKSLDHYCFVLVDINMTEKTVNAVTYSLGHPDKPRNLEIVDKWHRALYRPAPDKPVALSPAGVATDTTTLKASAFSGMDTLMSSQFQLTEISGTFDTPLIDIIRDFEDYYGDSGPPNYEPLNLNAGINLSIFKIDSGILITGQTYQWRMRYRDRNLRWSDWSDTLQFLVTPYGIKENTNQIIFRAFPNPFRESTCIEFSHEGGITEILVYDIRGIKVKTLPARDCPVGRQIIQWDGKNDNGTKCGSGVYICVIKTRSQIQNLKLIRQ